MIQPWFKREIDGWAIQHDVSSVEMRYVFADGEEGFTGALALRLSYRVT